MKGEPMTRRELIRALGTAALSAFPAAAFTAGRRQPEKRQAAGPILRVALIPCSDYEPKSLLEAIRAGWRLTRPPDVNSKRVVIKPNIADFAANRPIHTHVRLVEALILHLRELGAREILLAEGPPQNRDSEWLFQQCGFEAMARHRSVPLIDLNYDNIRSIKNVNPRATLLRDLYLPETILSAEVLISVAKMKTHKLAGITLSLKNMFGIVPGIKYGWPKNTLHWNGIPQSICEINGTIKTHYSIVDGVVGMEGHGPIMGTAKKTGVIVMGDNALSVDATAARVMGIDPARVDYLAMAQRIKLGFLRRENIDVTGEKIENVRTDYVLDSEFSFLRAPNG
jgi:uncharacterized protein (DUF362 family)